MKKFNRVLAMLLALVTVLAIMPISALAENWLSVKTEKTTEENVTSTDITVSVDPKALLSYIKDGDIKGLLKGISASGRLGDIMTKEELLAIIPEEKIVDLIKTIISDIDANALLACLDKEKLLACVDTEGLKSLLKDMDLKSYVKDGAVDIVLKYVTEDQIKAAVQYIDTTKLVEKYSKELMNLALGLEQSTLLGLVSIDDAIELNGVKFEDALNLDFFKTTVGYANLADNYVDDTALEQYFTDNEAYFEDILPEYTDAMDNVDVAKMIDDGKLVIRNLIVADVILVDELVAEYGYTNLADVTTVINKVVAGLNAGTILPADVLACLKVEYSVAVDTIIEKEGVDAIIAAIPGGYMTLLGYVKGLEGYKGIIKAVGAINVAKNIIKNGETTKLVDFTSLIKDIDVRAFLDKVNVKQLVKVVYESGVLQELAGMLDLETYLVKAFSIYGSLSSTITEIKINGAAITTRNEDYGVTKLSPAGVLDAITNLVPTLTELANIDDSGKLFSASLEISYLDGKVEKTKVITFSFVLESGVDLVRSAAAKLSALVGKIGTVGISNGQLVANINIPSEFASVLRIALEKMADSTDPAMNALKDKVLGVYTAYPEDFIAFAEGLTLEEVVAVLEAVDPALFGRVYKEVLASRYAQVMISYIESKTGYDISNKLEAQNLIHTFATIPTFEAFVEKLEEVIGKEITDHLPAKVNGYLDHTVYDVINKLAEKAGYDFDMQALLQNAAASDDPFAYLYTAVVNKVENAGAVYNRVKTNAIKVAERLLASRFGAVVADNCLMDFYTGNSTFVFAKSVTFDAKVVLEKGMKKVLGYVADRVSFIGNREDKMEELIDEALDMLLANGSYVTTGFNVSVNVKNVFRATFKNENGNVILSTLLPVGVDLRKVVDVYMNVEGFECWVDENGEPIDKMPAKDIVVQTNIKGEYVIEVIPTIDGQVIEGQKVIINNVTKGALIGAYLEDLNNAADTLRPAVTDDDHKLLGYVYTAEEFGDILDVTIENEVTTVYVNYVLDKTSNANIKVEGLDEKDFDIVFDHEGDACKVILNGSWDKEISFAMNTEFLDTLDKMGYKLVFTTVDGKAQTVTLSRDMLKQLVGGAGELDVVALNYAPNATSAQDFGVASGSGAQTYDFTFEFGNADGRTPAELSAFVEKGVEITLPFANALNGTNAKTFVYVDEYKGNGEVADIDTTNGLVTFYAPHFSTIILVNKYELTVDINNTYLDDTNTIPGSIATITTEIAGWYEAGAEIKATVQETDALNGYEYDVTKVNGTEVALNQANELIFNMPAEAAIVKHYAKVAEYPVYYYANGALLGEYKYNIVDDDATTIVNAIKAYGDSLLTTDMTGDGWYWFGSENLDTKLGGNAISLYRVNDTATTVTINFYTGSVSGTPEYTTGAVAFANWAQTLANLKFAVDSEVPGYIWKTDVTNIELTALTLENLLASNGTINFVGTPDSHVYNIISDGNVNVLEGSTVGETVTFTVKSKDGFTYTVTVKTANGDVTYTVADGEYTFTMPAADVKIKVTYTAIPVDYDTIVVEIPASKALNGVSAADLAKIAEAPAGLVLSNIEYKADGTMVLTYTYVKTDAQVNKQAFINAVLNNCTTNATYTSTWIVNGVVYNNAAAAAGAQLPEGAKIVGWTEMAPNVYAAVIEYTAPAGVSVWLIICIVLAILLLIALIVLVYVLHVTGKIATSWLTKVCVAIVGGFFAFCMLMAKGTLKVLNFMGIKTEEVIEELPEETVEDVPAVIIDTEATEEAAEEAIEEAAEEAIEEATEEATEEAAEEAVEEAAEEATEEAAEEAVVEEAPAEEATEVASENNEDNTDGQ